MPWIASDMGHVDMHVLYLKKLIFRILQSDDVVIYVAVYSTKRLERLKLFGNLYVPDVTGMPNLIHILEKGVDLRDDNPVSV